MVSAVAIICVRNEAVHISRCLSSFADQGIDVILIDNDSEDETIALARQSPALIAIERLPWGGEYSLEDVLRLKQRIAAQLSHDWIIHSDADEWLCVPLPGVGLKEVIARADHAGFNAINFHELVFLPRPGEDFSGSGYHLLMRDYYFFQPHYPRLQRIWARSTGVQNVEFAGHRLSGADIRQYPLDLILRHYIALSEDHLRRKYLTRRFTPGAIARGWHANRIGLDEGKLTFRRRPEMRELTHPLSASYDLSAPLARHFWHW